MMNKRRNWVIEMCDGEELMFADGFDAAIIGFDAVSFRVVYDVDSMITILMSEDGMTHVDALDYLIYNVLDAYVGEKTPIYVNTYNLDD